MSNGPKVITEICVLKNGQFLFGHLIWCRTTTRQQRTDGGWLLVGPLSFFFWDRTGGLQEDLISFQIKRRQFTLSICNFFPFAGEMR